MKRVTDLLTALVFISLVVFISCKKGGDDPGPTPGEEQAELLVGTWTLESALLGTTPRDEWLDAGFSVTVSGNENGGNFTTSNIPDIEGASDVWPTSSGWSFGSTLTQVVRDSDDLTMTITISETTLTVKFNITGSGARVDGFDGSWTFNFTQPS